MNTSALVWFEWHKALLYVLRHVLVCNVQAEKLTKMRSRKLGTAASTKQPGLPGQASDCGAASAAEEDNLACTPPPEKTLAEWKQGTEYATESPDVANDESRASSHGQQR